MGHWNLAIAEPMPPNVSASATPDTDERMRRLVVAHFDFVWRIMLRFGVPQAVAEDATQDVFIIADRKTRDGWPEKEKSFLFAIALRVAADKRRSEQRQPGLLQAEAWAGIPDEGPGPDALVDEQRARALMDDIIESIPFDQRVVFVLFEIEDMTTHDIADLLGIPIGTVASRLRRGRELFFQEVSRIKARCGRAGAI